MNAPAWEGPSSRSDELRAGDELLRLVTEMSQVAVWEYDYDRDQMLRSANHDALYGLSWQQPWRLATFLSATLPDDRDASAQAIERSVRAGGPNEYEYDFRVRWPNGTVRWLWVRGRVVERDAAGRGRIVRGVLIDVTDRKVTEERLRRTTLLYATLSECNQAIVYCSDEASLFERICTATVRVGTASMAWIGLADAETGVVEAVCSAGDGADAYLAERAALLSRLGPEVGDLANAAIGRDGPAVRPIGPGGSGGPLGDVMAARGWRSAAAVPIRRRRTPVGALTLYSGEVGFFDEEMHGLLAELAGDIGFALDRYEDRRGRADGDAPQERAAGSAP